MNIYFKSIKRKNHGDILGVDGIMTSNYSLTKSMSEGAPVALGLLIGMN